jgi:carbon storage regulator
MMLVLSRKAEEQLFIDGRIEVKVLAVSGSRVKLGITAPNDVGIQRGELALGCLQPPSDREIRNCESSLPLANA